MSHIINNLDKLFSVNFIMLAFMITAITILQAIKGGRIEDFKRAGLFAEVVDVFNSALLYNFISGIFVCIVYFAGDLLKNQEYFLKCALCGFCFLLFSISLYKVYKAYKLLVYFIKMQNK